MGRGSTHDELALRRWRIGVLFFVSVLNYAAAFTVFIMIHLGRVPDIILLDVMPPIFFVQVVLVLAGIWLTLRAKEERYETRVMAVILFVFAGIYAAPLIYFKFWLDALRARPGPPDKNSMLV